MDTQLIGSSAELTVDVLFRAHARLHPQRVALECAGKRLTYGELRERVNRLTHVLARAGVSRGERILIFAENRAEYLEAVLAAACVGGIAACLNYRLGPEELAYCSRLAEPRLAFVSERYADTWAKLDHGVPQTLILGEPYEHALAAVANTEVVCPVHPEDGLLILYTSGTTGFPKGALISHRAEVARGAVGFLDGSMYDDTATLCWSPFCHIAAADFSLGTIMRGLKLHLVDGFEVAAILDIITREPINNISLQPAVIGRMIDALRSAQIRPFDLRMCGGSADLVGRDQIAEVSGLLNVPYRNTFGATETGLPPLSKGRFPPGVRPERLSKELSSMCSLKLVDENDIEVPVGTPGEALVRGPTVFSGYWRAPEINAHEFRGGWFHMGDVLVAHPDGTYDYVDRRKYMIKSGGENIYPAEIERLLNASSRVREAVVVRMRDAKWGEVPVAFVIKEDPTLLAADVLQLCSDKLARYKQPKEIHFVTAEHMPRSTSGKVKRFELEQRLPANRER